MLVEKEMKIKSKSNAKCAVVSQALDGKPEGSSHPLSLLHPNDFKSHELKALLVIMLEWSLRIRPATQNVVEIFQHSQCFLFAPFHESGSPSLIFGILCCCSFCCKNKLRQEKRV